MQTWIKELRGKSASASEVDEFILEINALEIEVARFRGEIRRLTGTQEPGDLARPFEDCEYIGEDGCCEHPKAISAECHYGAPCRKFMDLFDEVERLKGQGLFQIRFDGPPGPELCRFIEIEDQYSVGINLGEWVEVDDGTWLLKIDISRRKW